jgi:hypothetical protein
MIPLQDYFQVEIGEMQDEVSGLRSRLGGHVVRFSGEVDK